MNFKNRYTQVISATLFSFFLFLVVRLYFYFSYQEYFSNLTLLETFQSFLMSFRVDAAIIFTFTSLLWLALLLPFKFTTNKIYRTVLGALWGIIIASIVFFNIGDSLYFGFVNRHISNELSVIGNDVGILVDMAIDYFLYQAIFSAVIFFSIIYLFYKLFSATILNKNVSTKEWLYIPLIIIIAFIGIRGKVNGISFGISDAFAVNKVASGNLALNGFFCYYRGGNRQDINHAAIGIDDALKTVKNELSSDKIKYVKNDFPLMRHYKNSAQKNYNVVIILIESLSAQYLDAISHNKYGVTPTLDKMAKEGLVFTNFYANGQRSLEGITSIFTGITQPVGFESLGEGLELYNPSYLGKIAKENGYATLSMQSSDRGSFRVDKLSKLAGFEDYYGAEDMPSSGVEAGKPHFGQWDGNMFRFLSSKLHTIKEPFISFAFTASTHVPYYSPGEQWEKYPHSTKTEKGFLNTVNYVDTQINEFMERSKKEPWFDNTIFIFTADHCNHTKLKDIIKTDKKEVLLSEFHIPLIVYAPKIFEAKKIDIVGSHDDIPMSILDILGLKNNFASISQSLFDESVKSRFAFVKMGNSIALTDGKGAVHYNFKNFLDGEGNSSKNLEDLLLSIDSVQSALLKQSKWMSQN